MQEGAGDAPPTIRAQVCGRADIGVRCSDHAMQRANPTHLNGVLRKVHEMGSRRITLGEVTWPLRGSPDAEWKKPAGMNWAGRHVMAGSRLRSCFT